MRDIISIKWVIKIVNVPKSINVFIWYGFVNCYQTKAITLIDMEKGGIQMYVNHIPLKKSLNVIFQLNFIAVHKMKSMSVIQKCIVVDNLTNTFTLIYWNKCAYCRHRNTLENVRDRSCVCGCQFKRHFDPTNFRLRFWITLWAIIKFNERRILS